MPKRIRLSPSAPLARRAALARGGAAALAAALVCVALPAGLSAQTISPPKVAVIDVGRILTDSKSGQGAVLKLRSLQETKRAEDKAKQDAIKDLQNRIAEGRLSLSEERLAELQKDLEEQVIALQRFRDDADREMQKARDNAFAEIEKKVMPLINQVGIERGYTLIFNKFQSGLVFARDEVDITDLILERFDQQQSAGN